MLSKIRQILLSQAGFSPKQLFAALQGAWLEPTPGYIWQENTGVTPTTTGGQTIGLMLDQSQGAVLGPELVTNGDFSSGTTGWTPILGAALSTEDGALRVTQTQNAFGYAFQAVPTIVGKAYIITARITVGNTTTGRFIARGSSGGLFQVISTPTSGNYQNVFFATSTTTNVDLGTGNTTGFYCDFDNISVREILGNHAAQSTAANRPTYQLDSNNLPLARHDTTDNLVVSLPNLGSGVYSASGSVYFATPVGMSALHNQSMGTSYTLPALSTDIYSWIVVPQRLNTAQENRLAQYMQRKAGIAGPDYLLDSTGNQLTNDDGEQLLLAQ